VISRKAVLILGACTVLVGVLCAQKPFRLYMSMEPYDNVPMPPDWQEKTEWVQARLMYPNHPEARFARGFFRGRMDWREGGTSWTQDYPRADRHFASALRRLTRINARSVEQPNNPDDLDDFFNWPWMVAGEMGDWLLTDAQVKALREYLLRGGFIYMDDFWNADEYQRFAESMNKVFPDRPVVEIEDKDPIFHTVYDLDDRYQILGMWALRGGGGAGGMWQRAAGTKGHWMGIYDDKNRLMVAMTFNNDVGDSWELADDPRYPERFSALGIRLGVNYVVYAMSH
jgi:Domain of unknown function (DUF4159)